MDIVERLRGYLVPNLTEADEALNTEAADEIERLRAAINYAVLTTCREGARRRATAAEIGSSR